MNKYLLNPYKARILIKISGIIQLLIGLSFLLLAPVEIYSFYLFTEGGPFFFEGFHIGSFLHGLIVAQIFALYAIGIIFILIGYGHIKLKAWTLNLSIGAIWFWIIFGIPVMIFFLPLLSMKEINTQYPVLLLSVAVIIIIIIIPLLLLFFYNQNNVKKLFSENENTTEFGFMAAGSCLSLYTYLLFILLFHIMIFYRGLFPVFGKFLTGLDGITIYGFLIILTLLLIYGLIKRIRILWVTSVTVFGLLLISATVTILKYNYTGIIELMNLPELEYDIFVKLPIKSSYLLIPVAYILTASLIIIIRTRNYYNKK